MSIGDKAKKGVFYVLMGNVGYELILFVSGVIMARLLEPSDFGIAGVAVLITNYMKRLRRFGFGLAIVQKKNLTEDHLNAVFMSNFTLGIILWLAVFFSSGYIADFFKSPLSGDVAIITSITFMLNPFSSVQSAYLRRKMDFKKLSYIKIGGDFLMNGSQIVMALMGYGVWSLAWPRLIEPIFAAIVLSFYSGYWPKFKVKKEALKDIFSFGIWVFIRAQLTYLSNNIDYIIVGKFMNVTALGFYERAFNVMNRPQKRVSGNTRSVLLSAFSRMQGETERVRKTFKKVLLSMTIVNMPIQLGLLAVAPSLVYVLFGEKWMPIVLPLQILNISGMINSITLNITPIITSHGFVKENAFRAMASVTVFAIFALVGIQYGLEGMCAAVVLARLVDLIIVFNLIKRITIIRYRDFFSAVVPSVVGSVLMFLAVELYQMVVRNYVDSIGPVMLFSSTAVGVLAYVGILFTFRFKDFIEVRNNLLDDIKPVFKKFRKKFRRA